MANESASFDWREMARFILDGDPEAIRQKVASDYYRARSRQVGEKRRKRVGATTSGAGSTSVPAARGHTRETRIAIELRLAFPLRPDATVLGLRGGDLDTHPRSTLTWHCS